MDLPGEIVRGLAHEQDQPADRRAERREPQPARDDRAEARRQRAEVAGVSVWVASAEDTILAKLEWARAGESERQLRDVVGVLEARRGELDLAYVERWVRELSLSDLWARVRTQASWMARSRPAQYGSRSLRL